MDQPRPWIHASDVPGPLRRLLCCSWTASPTGRHRLTPDGCVDLLWLSDGSPLLVCGPERRAWTFELAPGTTAVGVRFRPGALHAVFGIDVSTITDRQVPLSAVLGKPAAGGASGCRQAVAFAPAWAAAIAAARSPTDRRNTHVDLVAAAGAGAELPGGARTVVELLAARPRATGAELAAATGLAPRTLHRNALRWFGYGTATLARLMRFQRFLAAAAVLPAGSSLAAMAASAGYADGAHLARECRAITSLPPSAYLAEMFPTFPDMADPYKTGRPLLAMMAP